MLMDNKKLGHNQEERRLNLCHCSAQVAQEFHQPQADDDDVVDDEIVVSPGSAVSEYIDLVILEV